MFKFNFKKFNKEFHQQVKKQIAVIDQAIFSRLIRIGNNFVNNARSGGGYKDQTGNLRSSIGFIILKDGEIVYETFPGSKSEGVEVAKKKGFRSGSTFY